MNKKAIVITGLFLILSTLLFSQHYSIGIKYGINWSSIRGRYDFRNFESTQIEKVGGHSFWVFINHEINHRFSIQTELCFEENGFIFKSDPWIDGLAYSGNYSYNYITMPISFSYEFGKSIKYYGYTGITLGLLTKVENQTTLVNPSSPELLIYDLSYDPTDEFNKIELGAIVGVGIKIPLFVKMKLIIDTRYSFGLTKSVKNTDYDYNSNQWILETPNNFQNVYNRSLTISLGILYKINKEKQKE